MTVSTAVVPFLKTELPCLGGQSLHDYFSEWQHGCSRLPISEEHYAAIEENDFSLRVDSFLFSGRRCSASAARHHAGRLLLVRVHQRSEHFSGRKIRRLRRYENRSRPESPQRF